MYIWLSFSILQIRMTEMPTFANTKGYSLTGNNSLLTKDEGDNQFCNQLAPFH